MLCNYTAFSSVTEKAMIYSRPEVFHGVKFRDETKVCLPCFTFVVLEKPKSPSANQRRVIYFKLAACLPSCAMLWWWCCDDVMETTQISVTAWHVSQLKQRFSWEKNVLYTVYHHTPVHKVFCRIWSYLFCNGCLMYASGLTTF